VLSLAIRSSLWTSFLTFSLSRPISKILKDKPVRKKELVARLAVQMENKDNKRVQMIGKINLLVLIQEMSREILSYSNI
jgi:hypothetical protein